MEPKDLIFYEIYPTSFYDSNGDGIGDLKGIELKLDYVKGLGCNALWINPFYKSPFRDGGYDIEDFFDVDPKFGNLDDFKSLIKSAHKKGIKIIVDLVAGHASIKNREFIESAKAERNEWSDLFIWNDSVWEWNPDFRLIAGVYDRNAAFLVNFFAHQPGFNYGFKDINKPWQMSYKDERTFKARNYMLDIMRHWLKLGADGFRVDMAESLVKLDDNKSATIEVWKWMFNIIRKEYPEAYFVSEWANPWKSLEAGFDADFVLDAWDSLYHLMVRSRESTRGVSLLNGGNDVDKIAEDMRKRFKEAEKHNHFLALISGNHDCERISSWLDKDQLKMYYLFMYSMPGTPFLYYGDELMMKESKLSSKDGGFERTGRRIPMIWDNESPNHGFSTTKGETYLPFYDENKISVVEAKKDKDSLYNFIKRIIEIRKNNAVLTSYSIDITNEGRLIIIKRGDLKLYLNCTDKDYEFKGEALISSKELKNKKLPPYAAALVK